MGSYTVTTVTTTHSCRKCGQVLAVHSSAGGPYLEPPIRNCSGCGQEAIITTCNEWETLTQFQSAMFWQSAFYSYVYGTFGFAVLGGILGVGLGWAIMRVYPPAEKIRLIGDTALATFLVIGAAVVLLLHWIWSTYWYVSQVRASLARTADPAYKARCVELRKLLIERKEWDADTDE